MASNIRSTDPGSSDGIILRCKTEKGPFTLTELKYDSTVEKLKSNIAKLAQLKPEGMKFLNGYPPKPLMIENDGMKLSELNVKSGDTLIVECQKVCGAFAKPACEIAKPACEVPKPTSEIAKPASEIAKPAPEIEEISFDEMIFNQSGIMMRHVVPSNNSCLFSSIYFILSNGHIDLDKSNELRVIIADVVRSNPLKYTTAFLGKPNQEYCNWIQNPAHWGGAIELSILSEHFKLEIVAIDTLSLIAHRFGENNAYKDRIFLIYDGIHYDPLVLELENATQTMFPASDPRPIEMALEIAKEAKSSRQFTDIANFTLFCKACQAKFVGDKEVTEHARATGHCDYGEF